MIIIVVNHFKAFYLCLKGLQFRDKLKVVEKF